MGPAGPEDMRFGLDIEVDLEDSGLQSMLPGASTAGVTRPGSALAGPCSRPGGPLDSCTGSRAPGYMLALRLLLRTCQPPHFSLARRLWERVL